MRKYLFQAILPDPLARWQKSKQDWASAPRPSRKHVIKLVAQLVKIKNIRSRIFQLRIAQLFQHPNPRFADVLKYRCPKAPEAGSLIHAGL